MVVIMPLIFSGCAKHIVDTTISIYGTVFDSETLLPLEGATITVSPGGKNKVTDTDGYFEFVALQNTSQYIVLVQKDGYKSARRYLTPVVGDNVEFTFLLEKL